MHLWKSLMFERLRWIRAAEAQSNNFNDFCQCSDTELDKMVKCFLSRRLQCEDREYRKLLKSILEKYNFHFKGKLGQQASQQGATSAALPSTILKFESYLYVRVIHKTKKMLRYLH